MISASEALQRLKEGNKRFVAGVQGTNASARQFQREECVEDQAPFATILGCSDSRVPAEIVFDQGLGDLFVIRVAGNIVAPSQIGSVEFAADQFETPLVVVLGHSLCGAVKATLDDLEHPSETHSSNVLSIVNRIRGTVEPLFMTELRNKPDQLLDASIRANIFAATNHLRHGSEKLEQLIQKGELSIVGAEYSLQTGEVKFLDEV
ncbi:MAG: carbonic anhydrase [Porticoccaceae bacterium]